MAALGAGSPGDQGRRQTSRGPAPVSLRGPQGAEFQGLGQALPLRGPLALEHRGRGVCFSVGGRILGAPQPRQRVLHHPQLLLGRHSVLGGSEVQQVFQGLS